MGLLSLPEEMLLQSLLELEENYEDSGGKRGTQEGHPQEIVQIERNAQRKFIGIG